MGKRDRERVGQIRRENTMGTSPPERFHDGKRRMLFLTQK